MSGKPNAYDLAWARISDSFTSPHEEDIGVWSKLILERGVRLG